MLKLYYYKVVRMLRLISKEAYKQKRNLLLIQQSKYFDREWYRDQYPDVRASKMDPAKHYLEYGWKEMRRPSLYFSTYAYFKANPDVQAAYINPLLHYILSGAKEGRSLGMRLPQIKKGFQFKRNLIWRLLCPLVCRNRESDLRILVVLHLFYPEEWVKIEEYLMTLKSYKVTLKVTVTEGFTDENVLAQIRAFMPACEIITLPNIGFDVAPFIYILNQIDLSQYDIVYKLQSKGVNKAFRYIYGQVFKYQDWFLNLYRGIFGLFRTHKIIKMFEANPKLGLVAADNLIIEDPIYKKAFTQKIAAQYGISLRDDYRYVAGTCFVARAKCLKSIQDLNLKFSDFEQTKRGEFSTAHAFERIVCAIIENEGYEFKGLTTRHNEYKRERKYREKYSPLRLLSDSRFNLDYDFFYKGLESSLIYHYDVQKMRLGDVKRKWIDGKIYKLNEVAPFKYLSDKANGQRAYNEYCKENFEIYGYVMGVDRFDMLIDSIENKGFDSKNMPVIGSDNVIRDGQHRCCILLHKYGPEYQIKVLKIWQKPLPKNKKVRLTKRDCSLVEKSAFFDKQWYLEQNPDVKSIGIDPVKHYLKHGWLEGRQPSAQFDGSAYLAVNPKVKKSGVNPLLHYEKYGKKDGRKLCECSPKVSVIIPCYKQGRFVSEAVESVLSSTFQDFEIIIVNDGSPDEETNQILSNLSYPKTRVIATKNQGVAMARNTAIKEARGEYILPLDADDKIGERYLEKAVALMEVNKNLGIVYCQADMFGAINGLWGLPNYAFPAVLNANCIFCSAVFRKSDWESVGGYKKEMIYGWEDWELWLSLIELGRRVYRIPEVLFSYRQHISVIDSRTRTLHKKVDCITESRKSLIEFHPSLYLKNFKSLNPQVKEMIKSLGYKKRFLWWTRKTTLYKIYYIGDIVIRIKRRGVSNA